MVALRPESEGSITLRSNSVWDHPLIDPKRVVPFELETIPTYCCSHFASENDLNVVLRGVRLLLKLARTEPVSSALNLSDQTKALEDIFWPGDADPDKVLYAVLLIPSGLTSTKGR